MGKINNTLTLAADEMIMRCGIRIKMIGSHTDRNQADLSEIIEKRQITVDRAETDIRDLQLDILINLLRRWMIGAAF